MRMTIGTQMLSGHVSAVTDVAALRAATAKSQ
jgi:hypothetical protein